MFSHERASSFEANTRKLGLELDFYGSVEEPATDAAITDAETAQAQCVQKLLGLDPGQVPTSQMATLLAFTSLRTRPTLDALQRLALAISDTVGALIRTSNLLESEVARTRDDPERLRALAENHLEGYRKMSAQEQERTVAEFHTTLLHLFATQPEATLRLITDRANEEIERLHVDAPSMALREFRAAFARDRTLQNRSALFAGYVFNVVEATENAFFVLGDCGVAAQNARGQAQLAHIGFYQKNDIARVFLPLSPRRCLVGTLPGIDCLDSVDEINHFSAALSRRFFVSHLKAHAHIDDLKASIGTVEEQPQLIRCWTHLCESSAS